MKLLVTLVILLVSILINHSAETNVQTNFRVGEYVKLPDPSGSAQGFLQYIGQHRGTTIYALSFDIGSAMPSEDLRLFVKDGNNYRLLLALPMLKLKGYRCVADGDILKIFVTTNLNEHEASEQKQSKPLMVVDLLQLVEMSEAPMPRLAQPAPASKKD